MGHADSNIMVRVHETFVPGMIGSISGNVRKDTNDDVLGDDD